MKERDLGTTVCLPIIVCSIDALTDLDPIQICIRTTQHQQQQLSPEAMKKQD